MKVCFLEYVGLCCDFFFLLLWSKLCLTIEINGYLISYINGFWVKKHVHVSCDNGVMYTEGEGQLVLTSACVPPSY